MLSHIRSELDGRRSALTISGQRHHIQILSQFSSASLKASIRFIRA
jgi:hypothetical protein